MTPNPIWITLDSPDPDARSTEFLRHSNPYGVILFARHLKSRRQVAELCQAIHGSTEGFSPLIALDQEGGRVSRLAAIGYDLPGAESCAADPARAKAAGAEAGEILRGLGFDVDFAPVADLGPAHPGTGLEGRLFGDDPRTVTSCCAAFLAGLHDTGIEGCLKHFPGLGGTRLDSHRVLPFVEGGLTDRQDHLAPYRELAGLVPYVMVGHAAYAFLDGRSPATLHPGTYELLSSLGFKGLSVTDDLSMGAVAALGDLPGLVLKSLSAGASLALWVSSQEATLRALDSVASEPLWLARRDALAHCRVGSGTP